MKQRLLIVFGTRPEAIKMAPVVHALKSRPEFDVRVCVTGQHRQMLDQVLQFFDIVPDMDLDIMKPGQDLFDVTCQVLLGMRKVLRDFRPEYVFVHGDTTTCLAASLAAFYEKVNIAHVEAGLRTGDLQAPFPEEANRCLTGRLAFLHFAPTSQAASHLLEEGVPASAVHITGNTVIDALLYAKEKLARAYDESYWGNRFGARLHQAMVDPERKKVLVTGHRRENFGTGIQTICETLASLASEHPDWLMVYPVHMNPNVKGPVETLLGNIPNVHLIEPLEYDAFVWMMDHADVIVTDSGGIQEEAPSLGKPVLVTREITERPEAVEAGTVKLVGTSATLIRRELTRLLTDSSYYDAMSMRTNPYGDGNASSRLTAVLLQQLHTTHPVIDESIFA